MDAYLVLEGTWEEVSARASELAGRRVRVTTLPDRKKGSRSNGSHLTIEEKIQQIAADIPEDEWEKLPPDLTDNLDHYVYGTPRK